MPCAAAANIGAETTQRRWGRQALCVNCKAPCSAPPLFAGVQVCPVSEEPQKVLELQQSLPRFQPQGALVGTH